jgi:hypothetical protein
MFFTNVPLLSELLDLGVARANMSKTNCSHAALKHANLQYTKLEGGNFEYTYLDRADLQHADLTNVSAKYASLEYADLRDAVLMGTNLYETFRLPLRGIWSVGRSNSIVTSIGDLSSENSLRAWVVFDFDLILSSSCDGPLSPSASNFTFFVIIPISRNDMCVSLAISLVDLFSL